MRRAIFILALLVLIAGVIWLAVGGPSRSARERIEDELVAQGLSEPMAACMAERMVERLSFAQLRKLERLKPQEGEADIPLTVPGFLERLRRVDDPEVLEVAAGSAAVCAFSGI